MSDPMLPFKLMAPRTVDTTAQTQKDTRALASGEALQRLKDTGAMNLQRQKGMDNRQNTLLGMGINPTQQGLRSGTFGPEVANQLSNFFNTKRMLEQAQGYHAARDAGIGITHKDPFMLGGPIQPVAGGLALPATLSNPSLYREKDKVVNKRIMVQGPNGPVALDVPFQSTQTKETESKVKAPNLPAAKKEVTGTDKVKEKDIAKMLARIPPEGVPYVRPNGQVGRLYNRNGKPVFIADK